MSGLSAWFLSLGGWVMPVMFCGILLYSGAKKVDVMAAFLEGAGEGLRTALELIPALAALLCAVGLLRASGALELLVKVLEPGARMLGIPEEVLPLALMRPVSGSGSLAMLREVLEKYGADSMAGRTASVMYCCGDTAFYVIPVYCGAVKISDSRYALPAALIGCLAGTVCSAWIVRAFF